MPTCASVTCVSHFSVQIRTAHCFKVRSGIIGQRSRDWLRSPVPHSTSAMAAANTLCRKSDGAGARRKFRVEDICIPVFWSDLWNTLEHGNGAASQKRWARAALVVKKSRGMTPDTLGPWLYTMRRTSSGGTGSVRHRRYDGGGRRRCCLAGTR